MLQTLGPIIGFFLATFISYYIYKASNSKLIGSIAFIVVWVGVVALTGVPEYGGDRAPSFFGDAT